MKQDDFTDTVSSEIDPWALIAFYYPEPAPLRQLLVRHSEQVRDKALEILAGSGMALQEDTVIAGALLHDIGIGQCHAPGIFCEGDAPYIAHGVIGARMLRDYGKSHGINLEEYARICERHTGSGLSAEEIRRQALPIPERDYLPETPVEKLICLADKFFSKSGDLREKSLPSIRHAMLKFGADSLNRFDQLCMEFKVSARIAQ